MFYKKETTNSHAAVVLRPAESKRLIAKAVAEMDEIKEALLQGMLIIAGGTTNGYIARQITKQTDIDVHRYTAGWIYQGKLDSTPKEERLKPLILIKGEISDISLQEALEKISGKDVFLKGANALDAEGNVAVLAANPEGGTVGAFWAIVASRGVNLICPVGLEKMIASVPQACQHAGQEKFAYSMGLKIGLLPLPTAKVVTEIQAIEILYGLEAVHIASGGVMGSEGSVVLSVFGDKEKVHQMWKDIQSIKLE